METGKKLIRLQPGVDEETHSELTKLAQETGAKVTPYAAKVLKDHVTSKKVQSHQAKQEYGK